MMLWNALEGVPPAAASSTGSTHRQRFLPSVPRRRVVTPITHTHTFLNTSPEITTLRKRHGAEPPERPQASRTPCFGVTTSRIFSLFPFLFFAVEQVLQDVFHSLPRFNVNTQSSDAATHNPDSPTRTTTNVRNTRPDRVTKRSACPVCTDFGPNRFALEFPMGSAKEQPPTLLPPPPGSRTTRKKKKQRRPSGGKGPRRRRRRRCARSERHPAKGKRL